MDSRFALPVNALIDGSYRVVRVVGSGGFGITYEAEDISLGTKVALKEYYPFDFGDRDRTMSVRPKSDRHKKTFEWGRSNFLQEARTLARFEHPSIVHVTRVFEANSTAYMVMRLEQGQSFEAWLEGLGRPPTQEELDCIAGSLLDALEMMHAQKFLHRDIAPDNIIVRADGTPVLLDFGAARRAVAEMSRSLTGIVKAGYSPHEQYSSDNRLQGPWSDLYALGGTLYRAVTGKAPEEATLRFDTDHMPPATKAAAGAGYRPSFLAAIDTCLKVRHAERPNSVAQVRPMLLGGVAGPHGEVERPLKMRTAPMRGETRRIGDGQPFFSARWVAIAAALIATLGGAYGGLEYTRWQPGGPNARQAEVDTPAADAEARRKFAAAAAQKQAALDAERQRKDAADAAERQARIDAERRRKEDLDRIAAEEEAARIAAAETEAKRKDEERRRIAAREQVAREEDEARRKAAAEAKSAADREALTRSLQTALNRAGCYAGEVDGQWTAKGRAALVLFAKSAKLSLTTDEPNLGALEAVVARTGRVCPLECDDDKIESNGRCVAKPRQERKIEASKGLAKERAAEEREKAKPRSVERTVSKQVGEGSGGSCGYGFWRPGQTCQNDQGRTCTIDNVQGGKVIKTCR